MLPPGRRRNSPRLLFLFAFITICLTQTAYAASAVLGLDVGTEYIKGALVKPGVPLDIVLTKDSKRKEAAVIGFKPSSSQAEDGQNLPERLYGGDALAVAPRFSSNVYPNLKPLLGPVSDNPVASELYRQSYPGLELVDSEDGSYRYFKTAGMAQDTVTVEELLAMEIAAIKQNAENMAGKGFSVQNAVITVPAFYTVDERRAIKLAAELAGLEVMSLISDGLAVGLNYATPRKFPNVGKGEKPEYHLVYDMGAGSTTASILKFQARTVKDVGKFNKTIQEVNVIGTGWDRTLGGDRLNQHIVNDMVQQFVLSSPAKKEGISADTVLSHGRTMAKLWREAERLRQVLSANSATSANMESLYEDVDFKYKLSRTDFEDLAAPVTKRISEPINEALGAAELTIADIDSIVLHGGMVRTPFVQKELERLVQDPAKLRTNVNADEAAAFGAAFRAAGLSPSFKVKDIKTNDAAIYAAHLKWTANGKSRSQKVFAPTSLAGTVKQIPFNVSEDFSVSLTQQIPADSDSGVSEKKISEINFTNLTSSIAQLASKHGCVKDGIKTVISARLDPVTGIPEIHSGSVSCEVDEDEKKPGVVDGVKGLFGFGGKSEQSVLAGGEESVDDQSTETLSATESSSSASASSGSETSKSSSTSSKVAKTTQTPTINLKLKSSRTDLRQPSGEQLEVMQEALNAFEKSDRTRRLREESFNTLEAYLYRARDYLTEEGFMAVSTTDQRQAIENALSSATEWLHGEGVSALTDKIQEQYDNLKGLIDPVQNRKREQDIRPKAFQSLGHMLNQTDMILKNVREQIDKAADAAKSSASAASESVTATSSTMDELDELDDEPTTSSSSKPSEPSAGVSPYSEDDYEELLDVYEKNKDWLEKQKAAQEALSPSDEPVVSSPEIDARIKKVNDSLSKILMKTVKISKSSKSSTKSKTKTSKSKTSESTASPSSSTSTPVSSEPASHSEL